MKRKHQNPNESSFVNSPSRTQVRKDNLYFPINLNIKK